MKKLDPRNILMSDNQPVGIYLRRFARLYYPILIAVGFMAIAFIFGDKLINAYYLDTPSGSSSYDLMTDAAGDGLYGLPYYEHKKSLLIENLKSRLKSADNFNVLAVALLNDSRFVFQIQIDRGEIKVENYEQTQSAKFAISKSGLIQKNTEDTTDPQFLKIAEIIATGIALNQEMSTKLLAIFQKDAYATFEKVRHNGHVVLHLTLTSSQKLNSGFIGSKICIREKDLQVIEQSGIPGLEAKHNFSFEGFEQHVAYGMPKRIVSSLNNQGQIIVDFMDIN